MTNSKIWFKNPIVTSYISLQSKQLTNFAIMQGTVQLQWPHFTAILHGYSCLTGSAPQYLKAYCIPVSSIPSRSTLRSSARGHLLVPWTRTSMTQSRSFAIVGPSNWNKLPQSLRDLLPISSDQFRKHLKTSLFVSEDTDPSREQFWFKWRYINVWLRLQLQILISGRWGFNYLIWNDTIYI